MPLISVVVCRSSPPAQRLSASPDKR